MKRSLFITALMAALVFCQAAGAAIIQYEPEQYAVFAGQKLTINSNSTITGRVGTVADAIIRSGVSITGDLLAGDDASLSNSNITVTGRVLANDWVKLGNNSSAGRIDAGGYVKVYSGGAVNGSIVAGGYIRLNDDVSAGALHSGDKATVGRRNTVGAVFTSQDAYFNTNVTVNGSVNAGDDFTLGANSVVHGNVTYRDEITSMHSSAVVDGTLAQGTPTAPDANDTVAFTLVDSKVFSYGTQNLNYAKDLDITLAAGTYKDLKVEKNTILRLAAGEYNFRKMTLKQNVQLIADTSAGDVIINIFDDLVGGTGNIFNRAGQGQFIVKTGDDLTIGQQSQINACLLAYDDISVGHQSQIVGRVYAAEELCLGSAVTITYQGSSIPEPGTMVLLTIGGVGIVVKRRRRS